MLLLVGVVSLLLLLRRVRRSELLMTDVIWPTRDRALWQGNTKGSAEGGTIDETDDLLLRVEPRGGFGGVLSSSDSRDLNSCKVRPG